VWQISPATNRVAIDPFSLLCVVEYLQISVPSSLVILADISGYTLCSS